MTLGCLVLALLLTVLLGFVSYVQLIYLESLRIIRRESEALQFFRDTVAAKIGLENEQGSLVFSLLKHVSLPILGVCYFCTLLRPSVPHWQIGFEAGVFAALAMLLSTYLVPSFLYRRTRGAWLLKVVPFIRFLAWCCVPLAGLVNAFHSLLNTAAGTSRDTAPADSVENIEALITAGAEEGIIEEEDRKLIHSVVAFGDKSVREVMTPRPDMVVISAAKSVEDLRQLVIHEQYSRVPVYKEDIDNITGFVHVRDLFELDDEKRQSTTLEDLIRPILLVPETKPVSDLLRDMQHNGLHISVVVDEYGNTAGLVTMEDLVEEILGEIRDEHEPGRDVRQESESVYVAPGSLDLDRLQDLLDFRPNGATQSTTLGGLVTEWLGHVPHVGESVTRDGVLFEVLAGNDRRIDELRISRTPAAAEMVANS